MVNVNKSLSKTPGTGASKTTPAAAKRRPRNQALSSSKLNSNRTFIRRSQLNSSLGEDSEAKRTLQAWLDQKSDEYGSDLTISDWSTTTDKGSSEPKLDIKVVETNGDIIAEGTESRSKFIKEFYDFMEEELLPHIAINQPEIKFVSASWPGSYDEWAASDFSGDTLDSSLNSSAGNLPADLQPYYDVITEEEFADTVGCDIETLRGITGELENEYNTKIVSYFTCKPQYTDKFVDHNIDCGFITADGEALNGTDAGRLSITTIKDVVGDNLDSSLNSSKDKKNAAVNSLLTSLVLNRSKTPTAARRCKLNSSVGEDITVTTESGNEISMSEIKVVQNPSTNELALYIPENDDDEIPEGFTIIGDVVSNGSEPEESGEESEDEKEGSDEELDSSKKKNNLNSAMNEAREYLVQKLVDEGVDREESIMELDDFEKQIKANVVALPTEEEKAEYGDGVWVENWTGGHRYFALKEDGYYHEVDLDASAAEGLNCKVTNARVEQTEQGTYVVRGDSDRFGKDAILYENWDKAKADEYLGMLGVDADDTMRYKGYMITGSDRTGYVAVAPYGAFSPEVYKTVEDAKAAIDTDDAARFAK